MKKAPRLSECIRFPRQKTRYYVTCGHKYLKGLCYSENYHDITWTDEAYPFAYKNDALLFAKLAKLYGYIGLDVFSITYPNNQIRRHIDLEKSFNTNTTTK